MAETCYRHPDRETRVSCSSCGRPICPDCMTPTPVGMRCPECMQQRTKVVQGVGGNATGFWQAPATFVLIAINVVAFLAEIGQWIGGAQRRQWERLRGLRAAGAAVSDGEWYRLVSGGFLHARRLPPRSSTWPPSASSAALLEPGIGTPRFVALYFASLLAGAFGALALTHPFTPTVGASGAIFGIFAATAVIARGRGMNAIASEIGFLIVLNLVITFTIPGISIGGHLGGMVGGAICAAAIVAGERGKLGPQRRPAEFLVMGLVAIVAVFGALAVA